MVFAVARPRFYVDRSRAGRDDDVGRAIVRSPPSRFDVDLRRRFKRCLACNELDAVGFEECLYAADIGVHDVVLELRDALALDFGLGNLQSDRAGALDVADDLADVQQRLCRDAAPVQADAADLVAVDADDLLAELPEPNRDVIAAGSRADNDGVKLLLSAHTLGFA